MERLPVKARPDTVQYRLTKFVRRNQVAVIAASLVIVSIIGGAGVAVWQAGVARMESRRADAERILAEHRFDELRNFANRVVFDHHDAIKDLPGATPARKLLIADALAYLDRLAHRRWRPDEL